MLHLYCTHLLVEGCHYTSNIFKYKKKLFVWALISEIPFDLVFHNTWFFLESQNIFFTLLIGVIGIDFIKNNKKAITKILVVLSCLIIAWVFKVDYSWYGAALIYGLYFLRKMTFFKNIYVQGLSIIHALTTPVQLFAFVGLLPIYCYNCYNGQLGKRTGHIYYSFYALHLFFFYVVSIIFL